jgi:hypothetical protein
MFTLVTHYPNGNVRYHAIRTDDIAYLMELTIIRALNRTRRTRGYTIIEPIK